MEAEATAAKALAALELLSARRRNQTQSVSEALDAMVAELLAARREAG